MSDVVLLLDSVSRLLSTACTVDDVAAAEHGEWPRAMWSAVAEFGLTHALTDEAVGGFGLSVANAFDVIRLAGQFALPLPLPETMIANRLLGRAGLAFATEAATFVAEPGLELSRTQAGWRLRGAARRVPWARLAHIVAAVEFVGETFVAGVDRRGVRFVAGENIAKEPRDDLTIDVGLGADAVASIGDGTSITEIRASGAAMRCSQMAGAIERIAAMTIAYAQQRVQFGRPIGKFQVVQQNIAVLAQQAAAARAAADIAAEAIADGRIQAVAAAKVRIGEAAGISASIAHQVHGAMGFAQAYGLHHLTRRLWSWREEFGNEAVWSALLGRELAKAGADRLWAEITAV